ncbi:MAG: hypothetical protein AABY88_04145 [Pseudomonadota bacterium]
MVEAGQQQKLSPLFPACLSGEKKEEEWRINNIVNITIVDDYLNKREIEAKAPSVYMKTFKKANGNLAESMSSHLIGDLEGFGITDNDFDKFLLARAEAISIELKKRLIDRSIDARGQAYKTDDFEEEMASFE